MSQESINAMTTECERQEESCLYTSTCLYLMSRINRRNGSALTIIQIFAGGILTMKQLEKTWNSTEFSWYLFIGLSIKSTKK